MSKMKKNTLVEINRINELMVKTANPKALLTEQTPKVIDDVVQMLISPKEVKAYMKKFGMSIDIPVERFQRNFAKLVTMVGEDPKLWDDMIADGVETKRVVRFFYPDGEEIPFDVIYKTDLFDMDELVKKGDWLEVQSFLRKTGDGWEEITEDAWKSLIKTQELFNSLPTYLRLPAAQLTRRLSETFGENIQGIRTLDDFLRNLQVFFKDGSMTGELSKAIIKLMSNNPKFAKTFAKMLVQKTRFQNQLKLNRFTNTLDDFYKALAKDLDLPLDGPLMKKMIVELSEASENLAKWFEFLWMRTRPLKLIQDVWFGAAFKSWKSTAKTIFVDIFASGFWNWVLGVGFMKPLFRKVAAVYGGTTKLGKMFVPDVIGRVVLQAVGVYMFIGFSKSLKHMDIHQTYGWAFFRDQWEDLVGHCTGKNKIHDALTGQFYANATTVTKNKEGDVIATCKGAELQAKFIEQFELDPTVVKKKAEAIYAALNPTAHDESPWALFDIDFTIGEKEIDATIPSLTKVFANYLEFYDIDRDTFVNMFFDIEDGDGGMDIFKMSQVADYYEDTFDADLREDVKLLDNWAKTLGRELMSHDDFITRLEKMPYLSHKKLKKVYNAFDEIVTENQKHLLAYPRYIKAEDDEGFETTIFLNKCCEEDCKCPSGCNIGGKLVESDMGVALEDKLNIKVQSDWAGKSFEEIKKVFDEVYSVSSTNKCFLNPSPRGEATEISTWDCEEISGEKRCVKKTDGTGKYKQLSLCQYECDTNE